MLIDIWKLTIENGVEEHFESSALVFLYILKLNIYTQKKQNKAERPVFIVNFPLSIVNSLCFVSAASVPVVQTSSQFGNTKIFPLSHFDKTPDICVREKERFYYFCK